MTPQLVEFIQTHVDLGTDAPTFGQQLIETFGQQTETNSTKMALSPQTSNSQTGLSPYDFAQAFKTAGFSPIETSPQLYAHYTLDAPTMSQTLVDAWHDPPPPTEDLTGEVVLASLEVVGVYTDDQINEGLAAVNFVAGVYVRDDFDDDGSGRSEGQLWISPDIIPMQNIVNDPQTQFGEANWNNRFGQNIKYGQDNYIYIRMYNRGTLADNPTINLFWVIAQTNINVSDWIPIGTMATPLIQVGEYYVTPDPIILPKDQIPASGHYCFICYLDSPRNPITIPPDLGSVFSDTYEEFMSTHNQACWRNVNIVQASSKKRRTARGALSPSLAQTDASAPEPLTANYNVTMRAWPGTDSIYGLKVMTSLPSTATVTIFDGNQTRTVNILPDGEWSMLGEDIALQADEKREITVDVSIPGKLLGREYLMSIAQYDENITMGCVSYIIQT